MDYKLLMINEYNKERAKRINEVEENKKDKTRATRGYNNCILERLRDIDKTLLLLLQVSNEEVKDIYKL